MDFDSIDGLSDEEIADLYEGTNETGDLMGACTLVTEFYCAISYCPSSCSGCSYTIHKDFTSSRCKTESETSYKNAVKCYFVNRGDTGSISCRYGTGLHTTDTYFYNATYGKADIMEMFHYYSRCTWYSSQFGFRDVNEAQSGYMLSFRRWYCD